MIRDIAFVYYELGGEIEGGRESSYLSEEGGYLRNQEKKRDKESLKLRFVELSGLLYGPLSSCLHQ